MVAGVVAAGLIIWAGAKAVALMTQPDQDGERGSPGTSSMKKTLCRRFNVAAKR